MEEGEGLADFSLLGGPLHRLGCRVGLVRDGTDTTALGLVLGAVPWIILVALSLVEGLGHVLFSIDAIGAHVRLLVAIPLLFVCEALVDPRCATFVREIVRSQVVPATARPALESEIARIARWRDAWLPEACFVLAVVLLAWSAPNANFLAYAYGHTAGSNPSGVSETTWASQWYWLACMTLFRFLLLRWSWRIALWCLFLWRVSRLDLRLIPIHPDRAGGLGSLEVVQTEFFPLVLALSAAQSASLAQDIASGRMAFDAIYAGVALTLLVDAVLFVGPACVFCRKLWLCKVKGLSDYSAFAERYVNAFDTKWLGTGPAPTESVLGTADIQSLADLSNSVSVVRDMRLVPVSPSLVMYLAVAALLPVLPLVLFKYPLANLLAKFFERLSGF
jgi:hypothetical protein